MGKAVCSSMKGIPDAATYCLEQGTTMQTFTFLYNLPYYFCFKLSTVKKLAEFALELCL